MAMFVEDSLFSKCTGLPDIKKIGTPTQCAVAMEASKQTGSIEIVLDSSLSKKALFSFERTNNQSRFAFETWIQLRAQKDFKPDTT